jgi:DNA (cytosine-5)-methyltransferase 1
MNAQFSPSFEEELSPTLVAKGPGAAFTGYTVRRLTPTECARLQGFADWWCSDLGVENPSEEEIDRWEAVFETFRQLTDASKKPKTRKQIAKWLKDPYADAAEYKMWGNGVALPCVFFVLSGIVWAAEKE